MAVLLTNEELEAMEGLPHLHRCLYIFGIRKHMDYKTGLTGVMRKVSYKSLAEEIYVEPRLGIKEETSVSIPRLKRAVKILQKAGLVSLHSKVSVDDKQLILKCELALLESSAQNKAVLKPYCPPVLKADSVNNSQNTIKADSRDNSETKSRTESRTGQNFEAVPHQISDRLDKIRLDPPKNSQPVDNLFSSTSPAYPIYQLLIERGYYIDKLHHVKTISMLNAFVKAGITPEEAEYGFKHCDSQANGKPTVPWYYEKAVFQYRANLAASLKNSEETHHAQRPSHTPKHSKSDDKRTRYAKILRPIDWEAIEK